MKLNKALKTSLAVALVFGSATMLSGCGKDKGTSKIEETEQYKIYKLAASAGYEGTYEEWLVSIKGDKGETGAKGDKGDKGDAGEAGATWLTGTSDPATSFGKDGDFYYNSVSMKIFNKKAGNWVLISIIEKGDNGINGVNGKEVEFKVSSTHIQWRYKTDGDIETWKDLVSLSALKGENGIDGKNGATWLYGNGEPARELESEVGDFYLNTQTYDVYVKNVDYTWSVVCNLKGASGETGEKGENGKDGAKWLSGIENPSESTSANVGDFYLNVTTLDVYVKSSTQQWVKLCNIKGEKGETGEKGEAGEKGETGDPGIDGREVEFNTSDTHIQWRYVGESEWKDLVALSTLKGEDGTDGEDGLYVTDVKVEADKWGINTKYTFTLSDGQNIVKEVNNMIMEGVFYSCSNENDFRELLNLGITKIRLANSFPVSGSRLAVLEKENMVIDLNGYAIYPAYNSKLNDIFSAQSNSKDFAVNVTIKNGRLGSYTYDENSYTKAAITVFGGGYKNNESTYQKLTLNLENVEAYGTVYGISANASWYNADINAVNSKFSAVYYNENITEEDFKGSVSDENKKLGAGAYLPAYNTNNFTNCEFEGPTGAYVKGGTTNFVNSTFVGIGKKLEPVNYVGGFYPTGSALVVEALNGYPTPVTVNINGGKFESVNNKLIEKINTLDANDLIVNGEESAIVPNGTYTISTTTGILEININEGNITTNNEYIKVNSYKVLENGTIDVNITVYDNENSTSYSFIENYALFKESNSLINFELMQEVFGTYNNFYLNEGVLTSDSLKLNINGSYKLHLKEGNVNEIGTFNIVKMTDTEYELSLINSNDGSTRVVIVNAYTNSFNLK